MDIDQLHEWVNEFQLLGAAVLLGFLQLLWAAFEARRQQGLHWARGPRDEERPIIGRAARLDRAFRNYMETFPLFAVALLAAWIAEKTGFLTWWGSVLFVGARIVYVPLYAAGVANWRSVAWFVAVAGLLMITAALFMPAPALGA